jgi:hypothetical protein
VHPSCGERGDRETASAPATAAAAALALAGALAGLALPGRPGKAQDAPAERVATVHQARTADAVAAGLRPTGDPAIK